MGYNIIMRPLVQNLGKMPSFFSFETQYISTHFVSSKVTFSILDRKKGYCWFSGSSLLSLFQKDLQFWKVNLTVRFVILTYYSPGDIYTTSRIISQFSAQSDIAFVPYAWFTGSYCYIDHYMMELLLPTSGVSFTKLWDASYDQLTRRRSHELILRTNCYIVLGCVARA